MRKPILMPNVGSDTESGRIAGWLKTVGDAVARGDPILEVETEKSTIEIESLSTGTLVDVLAEVGDDVPAGQVIGYLDDET